jgi:hypothetical protein
LVGKLDPAPSATQKAALLDLARDGTLFVSQRKFFRYVIGTIGYTDVTAHVRDKNRQRFIDALLASNPLWYPLRYPAEYAGGGWSNAGADAGRTQAAVPPVWFVRGGAAPRDWSVMLASGARRAAQTNSATLVQSHCSPQWGLLSDIGDQPLPLNTLRRQVGAAISGPATLDGFETLDRAAPDVARLTVALLKTFDGDEDTALARWAAAGKGRLQPAIERHAIPFAVEAAYRSRTTVSGQRLVYLRVSRTHRESAAASSPCSHVSVLDAWVFEDDQGRPTIATTSRFVLSDCARRDVHTGVPFGIVRVDGRAFVASVDYYGESEEYRISAVGGDTIRSLVSTFGGGC